MKHAICIFRHSLENKNILERTAICSVCGPTNLYLKGGKPRCATKTVCEQMKIGYYIGLSDIEKLIGKKPIICTICKVNTKMAVDHDHNTNEIRGWLCSKCNVALGYLQDDPDTVKRLFDYIDKLKNKNKGDS